MDTLPLPPRPNLEQYKKRAKGLALAANAADDAELHTWLKEWLTTIAQLLKKDLTPQFEQLMTQACDVLGESVREKVKACREARTAFSLADSQFVIARAHGYENWASFAQHLEGEHNADPAHKDFEDAVEAVVSGDLHVLRALVHANPELVQAHSPRRHRATLLHYVAANGVEDYRQRTPANAVEIARFLLDAGAQVDALASTYKNDAQQTTLNLLVSSAHPAIAGLQSALAELLLDYGAAINGVLDDESPIMTALDFGYGKTAETLARRGARVDNVVSAAALGNVDFVKSVLIDARTLQPGTPLVAPQWSGVAGNAAAHIEFALVWACKFGRIEVAEAMLDAGVSIAVNDGYKMTALHWAAANGSLQLMQKLIERGAPLELQNIWGGTVLDSTAYFAVFQPVRGADYATALQTLIDAGANVSVLAEYPPGNSIIDKIIEQHGVKRTNRN